MTEKKGRNYERVGQILLKKREALSLSQWDVLRTLGYPKYTGRLGNVEQGTAATTITFLEQVGAVLGIEIRIIAAGGVSTYMDDVVARLLDVQVTPKRIRHLRRLLQEWEREDLGLPDDNFDDLDDDGSAEAV